MTSRADLFLASLRGARGRLEKKRAGWIEEAIVDAIVCGRYESYHPLLRWRLVVIGGSGGDWGGGCKWENIVPTMSETEIFLSLSAREFRGWEIERIHSTDPLIFPSDESVKSIPENGPFWKNHIWGKEGGRRKNLSWKEANNKRGGQTSTITF